MCSEGVSVWFACKLCKSFFLNADDFAYHKKKSHVQEFRNTKFIVFEEKTSPTESPPENWVSFLFPKEETLIHKIISSPSSLTSTNVGCDDDTVTGNIQRNRNGVFIQIDPESSNDVSRHIDDGNHDTNEDRDQVSNNSFELNCDFQSNNNETANKPIIPIIEVDPLQIITATTSTNSDLTHEKSEEHFSPIIKSTLKRSANLSVLTSRKIKNPLFSSRNVLQSVIQPSHNPYVPIKRLSSRTIQNASSHSNNAVLHSQENDRNHNNSNADTLNEPEIKDPDQTQLSKSNSVIISSSPLLTTFGSCEFCLKNFTNSTAELNSHQEICRLKRQFENILCFPCSLTFGSSDKLNSHNQTILDTTFSPSDVTTHGTEIVDELDALPKTKIEPEIGLANNDPSLITNSLLYKINNDNNGAWEEEIIDETLESKGNFSHVPLSASESSSLHPNENQESNILSNQNLILDPTCTDVNFSPDDLLNLVKTEYTEYVNEVSEFPGVSLEPDPFETGSRVESSVKETINKPSAASSFNNSNVRKQVKKNVAASSSSLNISDKTLAIQEGVSRYCFSCKKFFTNFQELKNHNQTYHKTQDGQLSFQCPHSNCAKIITKTQSHLKMHLMHVHSNARPFKCSYRNCKMSYKTSSDRNRHYKRCHT